MILIFGFVLSFIGCISFAYLWIDRSISLAYSDMSYEKTLGLERSLWLLENEWKGLSEEELLEKLKLVAAMHPEAKVILFRDKDFNVIVFDTIKFAFDAGKLSQVYVSRKSTGSD